MKTNLSQIKYITNGKEVNAVENVSTYANTYKLASCWSVFINWSYVDSLGLNACKWVVIRTGMYLFLWCGLVLFRLDETTNIKSLSLSTYRERERKKVTNTGHNEVISFDLLWKKHIHLFCVCIYIWRSFPIDLVGGFPLSWRLSHACLSMNWFKVKLRTAHYISYNFLWS